VRAILLAFVRACVHACLLVVDARVRLCATDNGADRKRPCSADGRTAENKTAKKIRTEGSAAGLLRGEGSGSLWTGPGRRIEM
jgi:hypothetical protein